MQAESHKQKAARRAALACLPALVARPAPTPKRPATPDIAGRAPRSPPSTSCLMDRRKIVDNAGQCRAVPRSCGGTLSDPDRYQRHEERKTQFAHRICSSVRFAPRRYQGRFHRKRNRRLSVGRLPVGCARRKPGSSSPERLIQFGPTLIPAGCHPPPAETCVHGSGASRGRRLTLLRTGVGRSL